MEYIEPKQTREYLTIIPTAATYNGVNFTPKEYFAHDLTKELVVIEEIEVNPYGALLSLAKVMLYISRGYYGDVVPSDTIANLNRIAALRCLNIGISGGMVFNSVHNFRDEPNGGIACLGDYIGIGLVSDANFVAAPGHYSIIGIKYHWWKAPLEIVNACIKARV